MNKKIAAGLLVGSLMFGLTGCGNTLARNFGGTFNVDLDPGQKLIEATWKDSELWYLTRPMREDETAETWTLQEKSEFGIVEGKVIFHEKMR